MRTWLKGGLIGGGIPLILWILLAVSSYLSVLFGDVQGDPDGLMWFAFLIFSSITIPLGFILGILIGLVSSWISQIIKKNISYVTRGWKIGFAVSIILVTICIIIYIVATTFTSKYFMPIPLTIFSISSLITGTLIGAIIGLIIQKIKKT